MLTGFALVAIATAIAESALNQIDNDPGTSAATAQPRLERARRLRPDLSEAWLRTARLEEFTSPEQARAFQVHALNLEPNNWQNWEELGRLDFQLGNSQGALRDFRQAAQYSSGYEAHYTLANAAFLLGDSDLFWQQMQLALSMVPASDVTPTLEDILRIAGDQPRRLVEIIPRQRADVTASAIALLANRGQAQQVRGLWQALRCAAYEANACAWASQNLVTANLKAAQDAEASSPGESVSSLAALAVSTWDDALQRGFLTGPRAESGRISDPNFQFDWQHGGFGWQPASAQIRRIQLDGGDVAQVQWDGYEPEFENLLWQWLFVEPGKSYMLALDSKGEDLRNPDGIRAEISTPDGRILAVVPALLSPNWTIARNAFQSPPGYSLLRLTLAYRRPLGESLMQGNVLIRSVQISPKGAAH